MADIYQIKDEKLKFLEKENLFLYFVPSKILIVSDIDNAKEPMGEYANAILRRFWKSFVSSKEINLRDLSNEIKAIEFLNNDVDFLFVSDGAVLDFPSTLEAKDRNSIIKEIYELIERELKDEFGDKIELLNTEETNDAYQFFKFALKVRAWHLKLNVQTALEYQTLEFYNTDIVRNLPNIVGPLQIPDYESKEFRADAYRDILINAICLFEEPLDKLLNYLIEYKDSYLKAKNENSSSSNEELERNLIIQFSHFGNYTKAPAALIVLQLLLVEATKRFCDMDFNELLGREL